MAQLTHLMIHCSDTPADMDVTKEHILRWHLEERGWSRPGYALLVRLDGTIETLIPFDDDSEIESWEISNGARGWNGHTRHICYAGGKDNIDTRTYQQKLALHKIVNDHLKTWPNIKIIGHNQVNENKYCPSYDVPSWGLAVGVPTANIDFEYYYERA